MSTVSNCTKTTADSSWGVEQIRKEIYISLTEHETISASSTLISKNSCDGQRKGETTILAYEQYQ